ncbi:hypothetical protein D3C85_779010 [compost metagenome]
MFGIDIKGVLKTYMPLIVGLIGLAIFLMIRSAFVGYVDNAKALTEAKAATANVLAVNASLNSEITRLTQDVQDRADTNQNISQGQLVLGKSLNDLKYELDVGIAARDKAGIAYETQCKAPVHAAVPRSGSVPNVGLHQDVEAVELTIAWKAYCKVMPDATQCLEKDK